jgi:hypothetical protein
MVPGTPNAPPKFVGPTVPDGLPGMNVVSVGGSGADLLHMTSPSALTHQAGGGGRAASLVTSGSASAEANSRGRPAVWPAGMAGARHGTLITCARSAADFGAGAGLWVLASTKHCRLEGSACAKANRPRQLLQPRPIQGQGATDSVVRNVVRIYASRAGSWHPPGEPLKP